VYAAFDGKGGPLIMLLSEGQMNDFKRAALMLPAITKAREILADRSCYSDYSGTKNPDAGLWPARPHYR
jgi:hypothetical protein